MQKKKKKSVLDNCQQKHKSSLSWCCLATSLESNFVIILVLFPAESPKIYNLINRIKDSILCSEAAS